MEETGFSFNSDYPQAVISKTNMHVYVYITGLCSVL